MSFWEPCWPLFSIVFSLLFRVDFLFVFGSFWSAILGGFWSPNRIKMRICDYLIFIDFPEVLQCFLRFGGCYVRLISVLFSLRFWHRFLAGFWIDFGVILGSFRGSKSVIFGIDF